MDDLRKFIEELRPQVRPDWLIPEVNRALNVDQSFKVQFKAAQSHLSEDMNTWADLVITTLINRKHLDQDFPPEHMTFLRDIFKEHRRVVLEGKFEDGYYTSIETIGLFFIYYNVLPLFVIGAIKARIDHIVGELGGSHSSSGRLPTIASLITFLTLEVNQIQRVYIAYHGRNSAEIFATDEKLNKMASEER